MTRKTRRTADGSTSSTYETRAMKPLVYEWDHKRERYVTPGDRVECLKERVVAADDYVAEVERLAMAEAEAMAVVYSLEGTVERLQELLARVADYVERDYMDEEIWAEIDRLKGTSPSPGASHE